MKRKVKQFIAHPLFSGSAVMVVGSNLSNFFAYIYHLIIGRLLGPSSYGTLVAVLSLMGLVATAFSFLGMVIVKFVSSAKKEELNQIHLFFNKKIIRFGILLFIIALLLVPFLSKFLSISPIILIQLSPYFLITILVFYYRSFLQGLLKFKEVVISNNIDILGRIIFGVIAFYIGLSVFGVVGGIVISSLFSLLFLKRYMKEFGKQGEKDKFSKGRDVLRYSIPVIITTVSLQSFFSNDIILAKHFFDSHEAGIYASLSTLGKIIFYGTAPVMAVMFPLVSKRHSRGESYRKILFLSVLLTGGISFAVTLVYYIFPEIMVNVLYGSEFIEAAPYLVWFGIFMTLFTLASLLLNYFLSKEDTRIVFIAPFIVVLQVVGIWLFHDGILEVVKVSIAAISFLLAILLIYFAYGNKKLPNEGKEETS